jgi:hypothetical protein
MVKVTQLMFLIGEVALSARAAGETEARLDRAAAVFATSTTAPHGIRPEQIDSADCIAVVPAFKKGAEKIDIVILSVEIASDEASFGPVRDRPGRCGGLGKWQGRP